MSNLILGLFSIKKGSMRAWRWKRMSSMLLFIPLFITLLVVNNLALALDWVLFPRFRKQEVIDPVFIVSLPRTGTTNVLYALNSPNLPFTSMKLWECLFAPSIIQRKSIRLLWRLIPNKLRKSIRKLDKKLHQEINEIHNSSLFLHEEDDIVLAWSFSTIYMSFLYPESNVLRELFNFDEQVTQRRKDRIMRRYKRLVERHLYSLNNSNGVRYLAKNPAMAAKVDSISKHFPTAKSIVIERSPNDILPSTELLISFQLKNTTDVPMSLEEKLTVYEVLESMRNNLQTHLVEKACMPFAVVQFENIIKDRELTINSILNWLGCKERFLDVPPQTNFRSKKKYKPLTNGELESILEQPWPKWPENKLLNL